LLILFALIPYVFIYGLRKRNNIIIIAYLIIFCFTFTFSTRHPNLNLLQIIKTFLGITLSWTLLNLHWDKKLISKSLLSIIWLPSISIGVGIILHLLEIRSAFDIEYTGALRLQGANIAPHLAMLAFIGFAVAICEYLRTKNRFSFAMGIINFVIIIFTGTRGAMLATIFLIMTFFYSQVRKVLTFNKSGLFSMVLFMVITIGIVVIYFPHIEKRMAGTVFESNFNTSGRIEAWRYFIGEGSENILFGRGLGAGTVANQGEVRGGFRVPHNEYIRMYVEGGVIGTLLLLSGFFSVFKEIFRTIVPEERLCFLALILGFALYSFTDNTLSTTQFSIPFAWYLAVLSSRIESREQDD
ncbi:MAG: O-antigen ligase family protein, partial [Peptococcales bacterium]